MDSPSELQTNQLQEPPRSRLSGRALLWLLLLGLAATFSIVSLLVFTTPLSRNELGLLGGLKVRAGSDASIYVGDRLVGAGNVEVSWNELLGATGREPLAIALSGSAAAPSLKGMGGVTAEALAGAGATIEWADSNIADVYRGEQQADYACKVVLLRRGDGTLDQVFVMDLSFPNHEGQWRRLLLPVRVRSAAESNTGEFARVVEASGGKGGRGMIPSRRDRNTFAISLTLAEGAAPEEFAAELAEREMWRPTPQP